MAFTLALTTAQSNDATYLTLTDATGESATGWVTGGNPDYGDIVDSTDVANAGTEYHLLLDVTVVDKNGDSTTYTQINLYDLSVTDGTTTPYAATTDLVWTLDAADLVSGGTAMGTAADRLTDGTYIMVYSLVDNDNHSSVQGTITYNLLIDGDVRIDVYDALREISRQYDDEINDESRTIMETILKYSYLIAMEASATVSLTDEITNMLYTLNKLNSDGSKYSW